MLSWVDAAVKIMTPILRAAPELAYLEPALEPMRLMVLALRSYLSCRQPIR